jgi:hypothetical protein
MSLKNLACIGKLHPHKAKPDEITRLLSAVRRNIHDAHVDGISSETRFDVAYKAAMQCGLIALMVYGYRPSTNEPGHHATVIQCLAITIGVANERIIVLDKLRRIRNLSDYSGEGVTESQVASCQKSAETLLTELEAWLHKCRPNLLGDAG